mgnify:FL=1
MQKITAPRKLTSAAPKTGLIVLVDWAIKISAIAQMTAVDIPNNDVCMGEVRGLKFEVPSLKFECWDKFELQTSNQRNYLSDFRYATLAGTCSSAREDSSSIK